MAKKAKRKVRRQGRATGPDCVFYVLMRNDLASLNPGKACAQATHAAHALVALLPRLPAAQRKVWQRAFAAWSTETRQGFGTAIVKEGAMSAIVVAVKEAKRRGLLAGVVHDPTYPLADGEVVHAIPLDSCAYVFGPREAVKACPTLGPMPLMR